MISVDLFLSTNLSVFTFYCLFCIWTIHCQGPTAQGKLGKWPQKFSGWENTENILRSRYVKMKFENGRTSQCFVLYLDNTMIYND